MEPPVEVIDLTNSYSVDLLPQTSEATHIYDIRVRIRIWAGIKILELLKILLRITLTICNFYISLITSTYLHNIFIIKI